MVMLFPSHPFGVFAAISGQHIDSAITKPVYLPVEGQ
jgi:hypothetical protein